MTKHTPGPWRAEGPDTFNDYTILSAVESLAIAAVCNGEMQRLTGRDAEHAANATLIAAAPRMLDALIGAEIVIRMLDAEGQQSTLATLRRAIDQATKTT